MTPNLKQQCERLAEEESLTIMRFSPGVDILLRRAGFISGFTAAVPLVQAECKEEINPYQEAFKICSENRDFWLHEFHKEREKSAKLLEALKQIENSHQSYVSTSWIIKTARTAIAEYEK